MPLVILWPKHHSCVAKNVESFVWWMPSLSWGRGLYFSTCALALGWSPEDSRSRSGRHHLPQAPATTSAVLAPCKHWAPLESSAILFFFFQRRYSDLVWLVITKIFLCLVDPLSSASSFIPVASIITVMWLRGTSPLRCASQYFLVENSMFSYPVRLLVSTYAFAEQFLGKRQEPVHAGSWQCVHVSLSMNVDGECVHESVHVAMRCTKVHIFAKHQGVLVSVPI